MARAALIVHRYREIRELYCRILQGAGYHCTLVRDGEEALAEFRRSRPPLVITNLLLLEELNGVELGIALVKQLRREDPTVPVIVASAASYKESEVLKLGAYAFLEVPLLSTDELIATAERALEDRERRQRQDSQ